MRLILIRHGQTPANVLGALDTAVPGPGENRCAFLIVRGDETVGVVELADQGGGTGVVLLDWVSKRFRDFTPGEFVYRESGIVAGKGFARLVLPPTARADARYLARVGFRQEGGVWSRVTPAMAGGPGSVA